MNDYPGPQRPARKGPTIVRRSVELVDCTVHALVGELPRWGKHTPHDRRGRAGSAPVRNGRSKARVLPDSAGALPQMCFSESASGIDAARMGNVSSVPRRVTAAVIDVDSPNWANVGHQCDSSCVGVSRPTAPMKRARVGGRPKRQSNR